jgi:FkbM family methyltransferase
MVSAGSVVVASACLCITVDGGETCAKNLPVPAAISDYPCLNSTGQLDFPQRWGDPPQRQVPLFIRWEEYREYLPRWPDANFIQVGANCGKNTYGCAVGGDPIWPYATACGWRGVAVEPTSYVYLKLCKNYARWPRVQALRAAVSDEAGVGWIQLGAGEMNKLIPASSPPADPGHLAGHAGSPRTSKPQRAKRPHRNESVPLLTLERLVRQSGLTRVDILVVDAEGAEQRILATVDLPYPRPSLILFERAHLQMSQKVAIDSRLRSQGYVWIKDVRNGDPLGSRKSTPAANRLYGLLPRVRPGHSQDSSSSTTSTTSF